MFPSYAPFVCLRVFKNRMKNSCCQHIASYVSMSQPISLFQKIMLATQAKLKKRYAYPKIILSYVTMNSLDTHIFQCMCVHTTYSHTLWNKGKYNIKEYATKITTAWFCQRIYIPVDWQKQKGSASTTTLITLSWVKNVYWHRFHYTDTTLK